MASTIDDAELARYLAIAKQGARKASKDPHVVEGAANHAIEMLIKAGDDVSDEPRARERWLRTVALNQARRWGRRDARDVPFGRQGSLIPKGGDEVSDKFVARVIEEMRLGDGQSLGSFVANKVMFEEAWSTLSDAARSLLHDKYANGMSSKEMATERGVTAGTIDNQLSRAKEAAKPLLQEIYDELRGAADEDDD